MQRQIGLSNLVYASHSGKDCRFFFSVSIGLVRYLQQVSSARTRKVKRWIQMDRDHQLLEHWLQFA